MEFTLPCIVHGSFNRRRNAEEGYIIDLLEVDIPEVDEDDAPVVVSLERANSKALEVRIIGDTFYAPLVEDTNSARLLLGLDDLEKRNWADNSSGLSQMLRALIVEPDGQRSQTTLYGDWAYRGMFMNPGGCSEGAGFPAYVKAQDVRQTEIDDDYRREKQTAARKAYQSCRIIDGMPYRPCDEPRYSVWFSDEGDVQVNVELDQIEHNRSYGPDKRHDYETPLTLTSFRLDRYEDMVDYIQARRGDQPIGTRRGFAVEVYDESCLCHDDEAEHLIRAALAVIEEEFKGLLSAPSQTVSAWLALRDEVKALIDDCSLSLVDQLHKALETYQPFVVSGTSSDLIATSNARAMMRPIATNYGF